MKHDNSPSAWEVEDLKSSSDWCFRISKVDRKKLTDSIKSILSEHNGTHNLSFHVYDDEEKIIVEMDSEKQKINITPKLLSDLEVKNIFYKLN